MKFHVFVIGLLFALPVGLHAAETKSAKPNVVVIFIDDMGLLRSPCLRAGSLWSRRTQWITSAGEYDRRPLEERGLCHDVHRQMASRRSAGFLAYKARLRSLLRHYVFERHATRSKSLATRCSQGAIIGAHDFNTAFSEYSKRRASRRIA